MTLECRPCNEAVVRGQLFPAPAVAAVVHVRLLEQTLLADINRTFGQQAADLPGDREHAALPARLVVRRRVEDFLAGLGRGLLRDAAPAVIQLSVSFDQRRPGSRACTAARS
jgi:hypothetical protein